MTIDALAVLVVEILGKYIVDEGATLVKEVGEFAAQAASQLAEFVMRRLKDDPTHARNAAHFEKNPDGYQIPMADAIAEKAESDPNFAAQLSTFLVEYKKAASQSAFSPNVRSNVMATRGGVAVGEGGVAVAGDVKGGIHIRNTQSSYPSEGGGP